MTIHIPETLENSVRLLVHDGQFASIDDAMAEAARLLLRQEQPVKKPLTEEEFDRHLLEIGLMSQLPNTEADYDEDESPITIEGEPLSETIIRERR